MFNNSPKNRFHTYIWIALASIILISGAGVTVDLLASGPQTEPDLNVKVTKFYPTGDIDRRGNFTVEFSRDMVPDDSLDKAVLDPPIEFDPPIPGIARWIEKNTLRFYPDDVLAPATNYKTKIKSKEEFIYGNRINEKKSFEFRTPPFRIIKKDSRIRVIEGDERGHARLEIGLFFNYPVDIAQLQELLNIEGEENAAVKNPTFEITDTWETSTATADDGRIIQYAMNVVLRTQPIKVSEKKQFYRLTLDKGLGCKDCGEPLMEKFEKTIEMNPGRRLSVRNVRAEARPDISTINVNFNTRIASSGYDDYIEIKPEIDFAPFTSYSTLNLRGKFTSGQTYEVIIKRGFPSAGGMDMEDEFSTLVKIPDLPPSVKFASRGIYLPKQGAGFLEIESVNIDELAVEINKVFVNNIVYELTSGNRNYNRYTSDISRVGRKFYDTTMTLDYTTNTPLTTTVDIGGFVGDTARGIFKIHARNKKQRWTQDNRMVMMTDIGISARMSDDYLMVWANSLSDVSPISKAKVKLHSKNNQVLLDGKTDSRGIAVFKNIGDKLKGFEPFLITVAKDDDLSYLKFAECLLPTSDFEVKGRPYLTTGYDAFIYTDRGVYRPGETAHISCIVRGQEGSTPPEFPYFITVYEPGNRELRSFRLKTEGSGLLTVDLDIPDFAKTGGYKLEAHIGEDMIIGSAKFNVEEFMPNRIRVDVVTQKPVFYTGDTVRIDVTGKYFFGAPAADHKVSGRMTIEKYQFKSTEHTEYAFTDHEREFAPIKIKLPDQKLDDTGCYTYTHSVPDDITPPSALKAVIAAAVSEPGGRTVAATTTALVHPYTKYIGLKRAAEGYAKIGEPCDIDFVAVASDGGPATVDTLQVMFYRVVYNSVLKKNRSGIYRYVSEPTDVPVDSARVHLPAGGATTSFIPPEYGHYKVIATDPVGGHRAAISFYASGWGYAPWSMETPDRIDIDLDREHYEAGEDAIVQIRSPFGGKLLLTIEHDKILDFITYEMDENTAEITIPVKKDYFPNVYITATVIKKAADVDRVSPARAFGVAPLMLNIAQKALPVELSVPEVMEPKNKAVIDIDVGTPGLTEVTVAAVDAGILRLTDFRLPDPLTYFHGKRMMYLKPYDLYSFIYPEVERAASHLSPPGGASEELASIMAPDFEEDARKRRLNPFKSRRIEPVALWSGIVTTDKNGKATVEFDVPEFNGKLVVMAVAVKDDKFGSASEEIIVRDKIIIQESFPRFVSPGDSFDGMIMLFNNTGDEANISVKLELDGPLEIISEPSQNITIADNTEGAVIFKLRAQKKPGKISCKIIAADGTARSEINFEMPNRPAAPLELKYGSGQVMAGGSDKFTMPGGWIDGTDQYVIHTSSFAAAQFHRDINFLVQYPYGCLEQTTSRLFPLLYFNDLARFVQPEVFGSKGPDYFIRDGILRLIGMMKTDGNFMFWPDGKYYSPWASIYASHFMIEAHNAGYHINNKVYKTVLKNIRDIARGKIKDDKIETPERIYAVYVLARAGKMENKILNYLRDIYTADIPVFSRYQLAGALGLSGDTASALAIIPQDVQPAVYDPETGHRFDSGVRTNAILLEVLNDIDPDNPTCAVLAKSLLEDARIGRWYTTQATSYALMALGKYFRDWRESDFTGQLTIETDRTYTIDTTDYKIVRDDIGGKEINLTIDGEGICYYYWQSGGVPTEAAPAEYTRGIKVSREYLDSEGNRLDINVVPLGEQVVCHIAASAVDQNLQNVVISDLLPAGFEIENPRLETSPVLSWIPRTNSYFAYKDIRDDRLLLFTNLRPNNSVEFYYSLRAISAGKFAIPPIAAECMYNPMVAGASSSGVLMINGDN